jgi:hypothetical protein
MKKSISTGMFLLGLVIWAGIISFLIELPFASILNTEDYLPASLIVWVKTFIGIVAIFVSVFIGSKRYIIPAPISQLALWITAIYFILGLTYSLFLPLLLGSSNVLAFVTAQAIISWIAGSILSGGAAYIALRLFSPSKSIPTNQV